MDDAHSPQAQIMEPEPSNSIGEEAGACPTSGAENPKRFGMGSHW